MILMYEWETPDFKRAFKLGICSSVFIYVNKCLFISSDSQHGGDNLFSDSFP